MTETQEEIGTSEQPTSAPPSRAPEKKRRSFGNKTFDLVVWPTVQWLGVWGMSMAIAKVATSDSPPKGLGWMKTAAKAMENKLTQWFEKPAQNPTVQKLWKSDAKEWAQGWTLWTLIGMGGTSLTPVIKFFERRRERISARIDSVFNKSDVDPDKIALEPKQTWFSILSGRAAAVTVSAAIFTALGPKRMDEMAKTVGQKATDVYAALKPNGDKENFKKWAYIGMFDLILSSATALTSYVYSRLVARRADRKAAFVPPEYGQGEAVPEPQSLAPEQRFTAQMQRPLASHAERATREKSESNLQPAL